MYNQLLYCSELIKARDVDLSEKLFKRWLSFNLTDRKEYFDFVESYLISHNNNFCHLLSFAHEVLTADYEAPEAPKVHMACVPIKYANNELVSSFKVKTLYQLKSGLIMSEKEFEEFLKKNSSYDLWGR